MKFIKMHGLGNDFVILDHRKGGDALAPERVRAICDRRRGVGCDQLIVMAPSEQADLFMRIYNADGSEAESCGNATRCVADLYMKEAGQGTCTIETRRGSLPCRAVDGGLIAVDMGPPVTVQDLEQRFGSYENPVTVNVGNPHAVFFVKEAEEVPLAEIGPVIETDRAFPDKTNVAFAEARNNQELRVRVWERGAGITPACGSGACAVMVAAAHKGLTGRKATIEMDGGLLHMEWRESDDHILMTGPVAYAFKGVLND